MSEEIDLIRRIAAEHREIHVMWKLYYENNPEEEEIYGNYSGSRHFKIKRPLIAEIKVPSES